MIDIRPESPADYEAIHQVNVAAFGRTNEAELVDALRRDQALVLSLVAGSGGLVVGHIAFSTARVIGDGAAYQTVALGPMSVLPDHQNQGIGSGLVRAGLAALQRQGTTLVFVLGHPGYYPRFGFEPASQYGVRCEFDVAPEVFMVVALGTPPLGRRPVPSGTLTYHPDFRGV